MQQLHKLIHSMTKAEIRHFRIHTKFTVEPPKYLSLFTFLSKTIPYNEEKITKKGFAYADKKLLMEKILESLHIFHSKKSVDAEIQLLLNQAYILREKSIWSEAMKRLEKAKMLATENERLLLLVQVINEKIYVSGMQGLEQDVSDLVAKHKKVMKQLIEETNYLYSLDEIPSIVRSEMSNSERVELLEKHDNDYQYPSSSSTAYSKMLYYKAQNLLTHSLERGEQQRYDSTKNIVEICHKHSHLFLNFPSDTTIRYLECVLEIKQKNNEVLNIFDVIDNLPDKSSITINTAYIFFLNYCIIHPNRQQGEAIIQKLTEQSIDNLPFSLKIEFLYIAMKFYTVFEDWNKADQMYQQICAIKRSTMHKNLQIGSRFYCLILNYELEEDLTIHIQSVKKYLQRNHCYNDTEKEILKIFDELNKAYRHRDKIVIWEKLYQFMKKVSGIHRFQIPAALIGQWSRSKIEDTTITEMIRKK